MKIAVVGNSGYIARFLIDRFKAEEDVESILQIGRGFDADVNLDLQDAEMFDYELLNRIDYVIFTAAISGPDKCAKEFDSCWAINVTGTSFFIAEAIKRNCKVLFFSSDAVFGDVPGAIYTELSETEAQTPYGRMKKAVEDQFKESRNFKSLRLSYVVSAKDKFISYCLNCIKNSEVAEIFHPFYRNCITITDVIEAVIWLVRNWEDYNAYALNLAGSELVSRVRMADELNRHLGNVLQYKIITPEEQFYKNRPRITQMQSIYLDEYEILEKGTFTEKIKRELEMV